MVVIMSNVKMEVVTFENFEGETEDGKELVQEFVQQSDQHIELKKSVKVDEDGNKIDEEIQGYTRHSDIVWDSVAILLMTNTQGVLEFLEWAAKYPGLTIGFSTSDGNRLKIFSDNALVKIEANLNINLNVIGKYEKNKSVVEVPEEEWRQIYDAVDHDEINIDMSEENEIGL